MSRRIVIGRMTRALFRDARRSRVPGQDNTTSLFGCGALHWAADGLLMVTFVVHLHRALPSSVARDERGMRM
jgi:hypothetical protein